MPVNLSQYRGKVGTFNNRYLIRFRNSYQHFKYYLKDIDIAFDVICILTTISIFVLSLIFGIFVCNTIKTFLFSRFRKIKGVLLVYLFSHFLFLFFSRKLLLSGDIETNPGSRRNLNNHCTICHWNLNNISAHNFARVQLLKAYLAVHKFDIVCLSETYLNSSFTFDDDNLDIPGYIMVRADHPANSKCGGVCMYYKNRLPLKVLDIRFLHESIAFELRIGDKLCSFISLYRSPNQSYDDFVSFLDNFELTLDTLAQKNPFLMVAVGDFNAKSRNWYNKDITSDEGRKIEAVTSQNGLHQEINETTHILNNSSSCIDLIFNSQPNLLIESGVHPSLHLNCHHQIIFAKFNLDIIYPPPYERELWHYQKAQ